MRSILKAFLPLIFLSVVIITSGCINLDPESFARTMPMAQEFLDEHPNAELHIVHYTATEAESILDQIKEDCGKTTIEAKEYYFVNITDPDTDLVMRAWIDWGNRIVECVYKEGSLNKPISECTPRYEAECFGDHIYWFDSCGNREDKREFCPMGCSGDSCILSSEHCDIDEVYTEKPPCTCPPGYEMILIYPKCTENECMGNCENECRENVIMPCIDICVSRYECGEDESCLAEVNGKCRTMCHEKDDLSECMRECSLECRGVEGTEPGITGAMIMETLGTSKLSSEEFGTFRPAETIEQAQAIVISPSYTPVYKERCMGTEPVYKCVKRAYCTSNAQFRCYSGHVYWFDSCGHVQEKKEYCEYGCYDGVCKTTEGSNCWEIGGHCVPIEGELKPEFIAPDGTLKCAEGYVKSNYWCPGDGICCAPEPRVKCEEMDGYCVYPTACTAEAKVCSDNTTVGRIPPYCDFEPCPGEAASGGASTTAETITSVVYECRDGYVYGNYWCPESGICCAPEQVQCRSHHEYKCYGDHLYWFDSCGHAEEKKEYCEHGCEDGACIKKCAEEGNMCGGIAGIMCCDGLRCVLEDDYPDASGVCVKECAKEGEYTSGAVAPEYYFGCCEGLESFDPHPPQWVGGGMLCYDPQKGTPVCNGTGTDYEGWYYPGKDEPLKLMECYFAQCTDSDGGISLGVIGTISIVDDSGESTVTEECEDEETINECYCAPSLGTPENNYERNKFGTYECINVVCPNGCQNGACNTSVSGCYDSDGGKDYFTRGYLSDGMSYLPDECADNGIQIHESYCEDGQYKDEAYSCPYGCEDGACLPETNQTS